MARLSSDDRAVLEALAARPDLRVNAWAMQVTAQSGRAMYGYEINGCLSRMRRRGLVEADEGRGQRRLYAITPDGAAALEDARAAAAS